MRWSDRQSAAPAAGTSQPRPCSPRRQQGAAGLSGTAGPVPKRPESCSSAHGVWGEKPSLAPTQDPSRAPSIHFFIPSYVLRVAAPQAPAPQVMAGLGSAGKTRATGTQSEGVRPSPAASPAAHLAIGTMARPNEAPQGSAPRCCAAGAPLPRGYRRPRETRTEGDQKDPGASKGAGG